MGWVETHISRALLIVAAIGVLVAVGAVVIASLQEVSLLTLYLVVVFVPLGLLSFGSIAAVNIRTWRTQAVAPHQQPTEAPEPTLLSIVPFHDNTAAALRVENLGDPANVVFTMHAIEEPLDPPYRMRWEPTREEEEEELPERGQVAMDTAEIREVEVAYLKATSPDTPSECVFPWPGGQNISQEITEDEWLTLDIEVTTRPPLSEAWRQWFALNLR